MPLRLQFLHLWPPKGTSHFIFCFLHCAPGLASIFLFAEPLPRNSKAGSITYTPSAFAPAHRSFEGCAFHSPWYGLHSATTLREIGISTSIVELRMVKWKAHAAIRLLKADGRLVFPALSWPKSDIPIIPRSCSPEGLAWVWGAGRGSWMRLHAQGAFLWRTRRVCLTTRTSVMLCMLNCSSLG